MPDPDLEPGKYAIADYLPADALEYAAGVQYESSQPTIAAFPEPLSCKGRCALAEVAAFMLIQKGLELEPHKANLRQPGPDEFHGIMQALGYDRVPAMYESEAHQEAGESSDTYYDFESAYNAFVQDFDAGKITDLKVAFGIAPKEPSKG